MSKHKIHNLDSLDLHIAELKNKQLVVEQHSKIIGVTLNQTTDQSLEIPCLKSL